MPVSLFNKAYTELSKLHKEFLYHGDIKLDNFKVDLETGKVTLVNFMFCGDSFQGLFSVSQKILTAEKKKLFNLFADYMTEEEITNLTI